METIKQILIRRDGMSEQDADELINEANAELYDRLDNNKDADDICQEYFGLEPDYLIELLHHS